MFTVLRAFLPNEQAWVFRWLFRTVMPMFLGQNFFQKTRLLITDGDSQETSQLDCALSLYFAPIMRLRCGWQIVDRGWLRHCPGIKSVATIIQPKFKKIVGVVKGWIYSWMKSDCETKEQYEVSKALLRSYLASKRVVSILGEEGSASIVRFILKYVEPYELNYCFYLRLGVRHYDTYTNCAHEGTNNGLKHCGAPVLPVHSISRSATILTENVSK
jgi:hypothetical protein